jgi:hypothetical protein
MAPAFAFQSILTIIRVWQRRGYPEEKKRHAGEPYAGPDENGTVTKTPIAVTMNEGHKLDRMSRIDFESLSAWSGTSMLGT